MSASTSAGDDAATVSRSVRVAASPDAVYAILTDLDELAAIGDEIHAMRWRRGSADVVGSVFTGANRNGVRRWSTRCTVTDASPGVRFGFTVRAPLVGPVARWRYDLAADGHSCEVTESTWDERPGWFRGPAGFVTGVRDRTAASERHIEATLARLKQRVERT